MLKISIPKPCHEDWSKMSPNEQGRHCDSCAKTVVDFTAMSDDEVKHFFINKKEERVCGRFQQKQLDQIVIDLPSNIFRIDMPLWKKFLVASLVVFSTTLFSCNTSIDGQLTQNGQPLVLLENVSNKLEPISNGMVGMFNVRMVPDTTQPVLQTCTITKGMTVLKEEPQLMGDIHMAIPDTTKPVLVGEPVIVPPVKDTVVHLMGKPSIEMIKNPPKADEKDCDKKTYQ